MDALGIFLLIFGAYLVDSAVVNRKPVTTLLGIITNPGQARKNLAASRGQGFQTATVTSASNAGTTTGAVAGNGSVAAQGAVAFAKSKIGLPYKWGATGPNSYDCSGLVQAAYKSVGVSLPRTTVGMVAIGQRIDRASLLIGDLVFPDPGHVQLYAGGGQVVEAPRAGEKVRQVPMWGFFTARRVA